MDDEYEDDQEGFHIDSSVKRMSEQTMELLDSLMDEVNELVDESPEKSKSKDKSKRSSSSKSKNKGRHSDDEDDDDEDEDIQHYIGHDNGAAHDHDDRNGSSERTIQRKKAKAPKKKLSLGQQLQRLDEHEVHEPHDSPTNATLAGGDKDKRGVFSPANSTHTLKTDNRNIDNEDDSATAAAVAGGEIQVNRKLRSFGDDDDDDDDDTADDDTATSSLHTSGLDTCGDSYTDYDYDDMSEDGSIGKEMKRLRQVQNELQKDLNSQDMQTLIHTIERIGQEPTSPQFQKILTTDDKDIIRRILNEEMEKEKNSMPLASKHAQSLSMPLLASVVIVWGVVAYIIVRELNQEEL